MLFLPACVPAVYTEIGPCHVRACWTEQEHRCAAKVFRLAELAEHVLRGPICAALWVEAKELFDHRGDDVAWRYGVDADAVLAPFRSEVLG